uniref:Uncharacterized protein n=1 Tax=Anguilla anguilla TaxID=7936 RepID=A0A0E9UP31_ANGAN
MILNALMLGFFSNNCKKAVRCLCMSSSH